MKRLLLGLIAAVCVLSASAQKTTKVDSIYISGRVVDSFTRDLLDSVVVEIMTADTATVLDTLWNVKMHPQENFTWGMWYHEGFEGKVPQFGHYVLRSWKQGYQTNYTPMNIPQKKYNKRVKYWEVDDILLKKQSKNMYTNLDEVVVTATRVKMLMDGDTVVYNADAFELSEGSMLDELVRQLPGVELREGGEIYINGNKCEELLLNGKDFFKGDAKVALDNLPAYTVQNIKAYQKADKMAYLDKHHEENKKKDPWVIDVNLKKEYNQGWLGNAEAGYGTNNRYMGRLFATRFTDHSRLTVFANSNNVNNQGRPGEESSWRDNSTPTGEMDVVTGGVDFHVDSKTKKTEFNTSLSASHTKTANETDQSSTTFLSSGDIFGRNRTVSDNTTNSMNWWGSLEIPKKELWINISPNLSFSRSHNNSLSHSATFTADPMDSYRGASLDSLYQPLGSSRLDSILTNRTQNQTLGTSSNLNSNLGIQVYTVAPWNGEHIGVSLNGSYSDNRNKQFSHYDLRQTHADGDYRNQYDMTPNRNASFSADFDHQFIELPFGTIGMNYVYRYNYQQGRRNIYRLDQYDDWGADSDRRIGLLPSTTDSLNAVIDARNSYHTVNRDQMHGTKLTLMKGGEWGFYWLYAGLNHSRKTIEDTRYELMPQLTRKFNLPEVIARFRYKEFDVNVNYSQNAPEMSYLLNIRDDSNPLSISLGNADLKNSSTESMNLGYRHNNTEKQRNWWVGANASMQQNSIGNAMTYNRQTGVYTYQPRNISGNWNMGGQGSFAVPLDHKKHLILHGRSSLNYQCSVDYALEEGNEESTTSRVNNYTADNELRLEYQKGGYRVSANAEADYQHSTSQRMNFSTINTVDYNYGVSGTLKMKHAWEIDTDLTMHSRRGYEDATMNDNNLVWNVALSKAFLKGKQLTVKLIGHDILQQLTSVRRTINAQGRTETWYNTQPAYGMVTLGYRLNIKPKKSRE